MVLETTTLPIELQTFVSQEKGLLCFLVGCMLAAEAAILLVFHAGWVETLVLAAIVVPLVAHCALEGNQFSWHFLNLY